MGKELYTYNHNFFKNIDNEESAYWLGFIMADGCITKNKLIIALSEKDISHLEKFKKSILSNHPIKTYKCQSGFSVLDKKRSIIQIINDDFVKDLQNVGIFKKKSLINIFPKISENFINHFMRGYFDGDGSVYTINVTKKNFKYVGMNICGTYEFLLEYVKLLNLPINLIYKDKRKNTNTWNLKIVGMKRCKPVYMFLYKDSTIFMERKKDIWMENFKMKNVEI